DIWGGAGDLNARVPHGHGRRCHRGATDANEVNGTNRRMHIDAKIEKTVSEGSGKLEKVESFHPNRIARDALVVMGGNPVTFAARSFRPKQTRATRIRSGARSSRLLPSAFRRRSA